MLVLTRRPGEAIIINGDIIVRVLQINGNQIRLGIEAPENINIVREELTHVHNAGEEPKNG